MVKVELPSSVWNFSLPFAEKERRTVSVLAEVNRVWSRSQGSVVLLLLIEAVSDPLASLGSNLVYNVPEPAV